MKIRIRPPKLFIKKKKSTIYWPETHKEGFDEVYREFIDFQADMYRRLALPSSYWNYLP